MSRPVFMRGSAACLLLLLGTLGACEQTNHQADYAAGASQNAQEAHSTTTARVARHAERAARDVSRSVTAVAKGLEKGVREGVRQGQRDYHAQQAYNDRSQGSTPPPRTERAPPSD
jgi:cytochrome c-type biogenesis protein CcmH/NrfF